MKSHFEFRSVGQGLFYTGILNADNDKKYAFVYDCGTESSQKHVEREIDKFVSEIASNNSSQSHCESGKSIDFVVISHLHKDHFSGLVSLMKKCLVRRIFLPYLGRKNANLTRLIIAYAVSANDVGSAEYDNDNNLKLFNRVIVLYGNEQENRDTEIVFLGESDDDIVRSSQRLVYSRREIDAPLNHFWKFVFLNKRMNDNDLEKLENEVTAAMSSVLGVSTVEECLKTDEGTKKIKIVYERVFGEGNDLNLTSTVMIHYPLEIQDNNALVVYEDCRRFNNWFLCRDEHATKNFATVLTGDAEFDHAMREILENELQRKNAGILQVPHHGSKVNWDSLDDIRSKFDFYIIPFGLGNKHNHPNATVIDDIDNIVQKSKNKNKTFCFATQTRSVRNAITTVPID